MTHKILDYYEYLPTSSLVTEGDDLVGDYTDLAVEDASYFEIGEVNAVDPCLMVRIWFSNVLSTAGTLQLKIVGRYDGSPTHHIAVEFFNNPTPGWDLMGELNYEAADIFYILNVTGTISDYINAGNVAVRFNHIPTGTGNNVHKLYLDFACLTATEEIFLTGNALTTDVLSGKTFYNTDPLTKLTGTLTGSPPGYSVEEVKDQITKQVEPYQMLTSVLLLKELKRKEKKL